MTEPGPGADRSGGKRADQPEGWGDEWDSVADVIVVGSGVAGMTAAVAAASRGASVIVLERSAFTGGTTAKSGGVLWIPNNSLMRERGLVDDRADALRYLARTAYPHALQPRARDPRAPRRQARTPGDLLRHRFGRHRGAHRRRGTDTGGRRLPRLLRRSARGHRAQRPRRPARVPTGVATRHRPHRRPAPRGPAPGRGRAPRRDRAPRAPGRARRPQRSARGHRARGPGRAAHRALRRPARRRLLLRWFPPQQAARAGVPARPCDGRRGRRGQPRATSSTSASRSVRSSAT